MYVLRNSWVSGRTGLLAMFMLGSALTMAGCSSSSDSSSGPTDVTISGSVFAAPVAGATCELQDGSGAVIGSSFMSGTDGTYSVTAPIATLNSDFSIVCDGGTFTDEATGTAGVAAGRMAAHVSGGALSGSSVEVHLTPGSTVIHSMVTDHGMAHGDAETAFAAGLGYTPDSSVPPVDATDGAATAGASVDSLLAGLRAAAMSQLALNLGLAEADQFDLMLALASDLSDGTMDGNNGGAVAIGTTGSDLPVDIQNQCAQAMLDFHDGANDQTALANDEIGTLPQSTVAMTGSYKVEYLPGMMSAMQGKTQFQIRVSNLSDSTPFSGMVMLMPMMHMAMHTHSTPVEGCTESGTAGTYDCTVFYLMASEMMSGDTMGYWDLEVMVGMTPESAHFYPSVMMNMSGDSVRGNLKGVSDEIMAMSGGTEKRSYYIFKSAVTEAMSGHDVELFVAAKEGMMSYPALDGANTLNATTMYELIITTMSVEVSGDGGSSWITASNDGNGYWTAAGVTGMTTGTQSEVLVRLTVNAEQKTTDGATAAGDGTNDYAIFLFTPGAMAMP